MSTLKPKFSIDCEGVILMLEPLLLSNKLRVVIKPERLDGGRECGHAMLNIDDDLYVSLERYYSIITTHSELTEAMNEKVDVQQLDSFIGRQIVYGRYGIDIKTALRGNAIVQGSFRVPQSRTICRNKLRVDYDWIYISGFRMTDDESEYRKRIMSFLRQNLGSKYKIGNFRSEAMKLTALTKEEKITLIRTLDSDRHGQWTLDNSKKLLYHNRFSRCIDYNFEANYEILADGAFSFFSSLRQITIPNSVKCIGYRCFYGCSNLYDIRLSKNLKSIGIGCFANCKSLQWIVIPNSVTEIESLAFYGCDSLIEIVMPDHLEHIGWNVFEGCSKGLNLIINNEYEEKLKTVLQAYENYIFVMDGKELNEVRDNE